MLRWRGLDGVPTGWGRCVVTIGVFDGVHRGHQAIIGRAVARARDAGLPCLVLTFDPHPSEVLRPGTHPAVLSTPTFKAELLEQLDVDVMCVLPFTAEFAQLSPEDFAGQVLAEGLHAAAVVVGANFRFGHKIAGDVDTLRDLGEQLGFASDSVTLLVEDVEGEETRLSSTFVRSRVADGDVATAALALGRPHRVEGVVVRGDQRGRDLGYPTANLEPTPYAAVPADGIYAGWLSRRSGGSGPVVDRWPAAISIGTNPTFQGRERRVEAYALDVDLDLYGAHVALDFAQRLRETKAFDSVDELVAQIDDDVRRTRELLPGA